MLRSVFTKTLWDQRRSLLGWLLGITAVAVTYAAFYPAINQPEFTDAMASFPQGLTEALRMEDLTSAEGYLASTVFGILVPILTVLYGTATGARAIAGEEETGALDLLLAHPVRRTQVVLQRGAALAVGTLIIAAAVLTGLVGISGPAELDLAVSRLAAMVVHLALLGTLFGALALALGALVGRRAFVLATTAVVAVVAYFGNTIAPQIDAVAGLQRLSPFYYYARGEPLRNGLQAGDAAVLVAATAVFLAVAALAFNRRDVAV